MIWVLVAVTIVSPLLSVATAYYVIRHVTGEFQEGVMDAIHEEIRLQDDRIRKGRAKEQPRNGTEADPGVTFPPRGESSEDMIAGQPVEGNW